MRKYCWKMIWRIIIRYNCNYYFVQCLEKQ